MQLKGYELMDMLVEKGNQVFKLRHQASGEIHQMHAFHGEQFAEFETLCQALPGLPPQVSRVIKVDRDPASRVGFVFTQLLPDGVGVREWIERLLPAAAGPPPAPELGPAALQNLRSLETAPVALLPMLPGPESRPAAAPALDSQAGESDATRLYRLAQQMRNQKAAGAKPYTPQPPPVQAASPPQPAPAQQDGVGAQPGEFTKIVEKSGRRRGENPPAPSRPMAMPEEPASPVRRSAVSPPNPEPVSPALAPPAGHETGLRTWLTTKPHRQPAISAPPSREAPLDSQEALPIPRRVPAEPALTLPLPPPVRPASQPAPQAPLFTPPSKASPEPRPLPRREGPAGSLDVKTIALTIAAVLLLLVLVLLVVEKTG